MERGDSVKEQRELTGGKVNYYLVDISHPQREVAPYQAECEDIIEALEMSFDEANIFKALWRSAAARQHRGKPGHKAVYDAEKIVHYGNRILRRLTRTQDAEIPSNVKAEIVGIDIGKEGGDYTAITTVRPAFPSTKGFTPISDEG